MLDVCLYLDSGGVGVDSVGGLYPGLEGGVVLRLFVL